MNTKQLIQTLFIRDCKLTYRQSSDYLLALCFWLLIVIFFPLSNTASPMLVQSFAPGIIWFGLILMQLLNLSKIFRDDYQDGTLAELIQSPNDFFLIICFKLINFWFIHYLPVFLLAPFLAFMLQLSNMAIFTLEITILLGTPILTLFSGFVASLTLGIKNNTLLLTVLFLPLTVPVLIFACGAISNSQFGLPFAAPLAWLGVMLLLSLIMIPFSMNIILKANFE